MWKAGYLVFVAVIFLIVLHICDVRCQEESDVTPQSVGGDVEGDSSSNPKKHVLVFGGNGFMGSATVGRLLQRYGDFYDITIVNRGTWYWDSTVTIRPYVRHFACNREEPLGLCTGFGGFVKSVQQFEAVIDFSAYVPYAVDQALKILQDKVKLYIYISTDSVYDVCPKFHNNPTKEMECFRPENVEHKDSYGYQKLQCEEQLISARENGGFPSIIFRLPDVMGPRDNTHRWWTYQMWIRLAGQYINKLVAVPDFLLAIPISMVYSEDVASLIVDIINMKDQSGVTDQVFNLAFKEKLTLPIVLNDISIELGLGNLTYLAGSSQYLYPSVTKGAINISKALDLLRWKPTPWKRAVAETVKFYEEAMGWARYAPREDLINGMLQDIALDEKEGFARGLKEIYRYELTVSSNVKDEL
ncbi:uncharacterized protein LOC106173432 [Lingula anatina]|uniref:Uncharacterized protein LOC106173432 n=1 Tax=Lingula anatina TaxID=7574 RepID=A0A1S3JIS2_LINAN|nr:uncharacterized protein LOC106173432 [Lingula anatina]|eukprot:XP_013410026.1 uncharacterized protein LOC106173432 [Lingula anatina]